MCAIGEMIAVKFVCLPDGATEPTPFEDGRDFYFPSTNDMLRYARKAGLTPLGPREVDALKVSAALERRYRGAQADLRLAEIRLELADTEEAKTKLEKAKQNEAEAYRLYLASHS